MKEDLKLACSVGYWLGVMTFGLNVISLRVEGGPVDPQDVIVLGLIAAGTAACVLVAFILGRIIRSIQDFVWDALAAFVPTIETYGD